GSASSSAATASGPARAPERVSISASAATTVATLPLAASTRRSASVGVPRSTAHSNRRSTTARRSAKSSATRSMRKVDAPSFAARAPRARNRRRSKIGGAGGIPGICRPGRALSPLLAAGDRPITPHPPLSLAADGATVLPMHGEIEAAESPARRWARVAAAARATLRLVVDVALPQLCAACREPVDGAGLCAACWSKLSFIAPPYCERLGIPFPFDGGPGLLSMEAIADPPAYNRARAAVRYDDIARKLVHALKYGDRLDLAPTMGRWMARAGRELLADSDAIVPVPLHWRRQWTRRFNQSALLAEIIAKASGRMVAHGALKRVK